MPLSGIRILDFTQVIAGPFSTQLLADMGADVIKLEPPAGDRARWVGDTPEFSNSFFNVNRNKKSVVVDLKAAEGKAVVERLLETSDVLVENFKPGTMERLGLGYAVLKERFPGLIFCSISGFGQTGPRRADVAFDQIIQGYSGIMAITGTEESGPLRVGSPVADLVGGTFASQGVLLALQERTRSGKGQWVDISMLDALLPFLGFIAWEYLSTGKTPKRNGNSHPTLAPSGSFQAKDGAFNISLTGEAMWQRFCHAIGEQGWIEDPRFVDNPQRFKHSTELTRLINARLAEKTRSEWIAYFREAQVPCGPICSLEETFADPQIEAREMVKTMTDPIVGPVKVLANPIRMDRTPARYERPAPALGEDTEAVLSELGYSPEEIARLQEEKVVLCTSGP
jgi:crotonobetainyl-CoA:carnitine CoA-transferase CaiB-like acyl-CoA transferase